MDNMDIKANTKVNAAMTAGTTTQRVLLLCVRMVTVTINPVHLVQRTPANTAVGANTPTKISVM